MSDSAAADGSGPRTPPYHMEVHRLGGRDPDGSPAFLGRWTFDTWEVRAVVEDALAGRVLNACAGKTRLRHDTIVRNDLNPDIPADHHHDVQYIDEHFSPQSFNTVVLDPPFDAGQSEKRYEGFHAKEITAAREACAELVAPGGRLVEFGWNSHGAGAWDEWQREALHLFQRGPVLPDVIAVIDRRVQTVLPGGGSHE